MRVEMLGPLRAYAEDGRCIELGGARLRMLLVRLALDVGRPVPTDVLIDDLWGAHPPAESTNALQTLVSRLRRTLGEPTLLESSPAGYTLKLVREDVDATWFEVLLTRARRKLTAGQYGAAAELLDAALELYRGELLTDVLEAPFAQAQVARLTELVTAAAEDRFETALHLGRHFEVLADIEAQAERHPLRERLVGLRMRALAAVGRQADALAVYEHVRATLANELGIDPSAELAAVQLAVLRGDLGARQINDEPSVHQCSFGPVALTSFVGRDDELNQLAEQLDRARLVTLLGPGGSGKTRLATEAAREHPSYQRNRVWFVALAGVRAEEDILGAVLGALGSWDRRLLEARKPHTQAGDWLERVTEVLGGSDALLVLDNCEHVLDRVASLVHELLTRLRQLRILVTSREPLAVTEETLCPVGPLHVPPVGTTVEQARGIGSVRLFVERAQSVRTDFILDAERLGSVVEICRRLDGMPLALELAAARLRSMTPAQIVRRLDDRFRLLTSGSRNALPRQRTLRAVVEWSWDLLDDSERVVARRLSVFPYGATVSAVEAVCADGLVPRADVLYLLGSLVEKSIVDVSDRDSDEPRYRMLETIRAYADERLIDANEQHAVTEQFALYFVDLVETEAPLLRSAEQLTSVATLDAEQDNILKALRWSIDNARADFAQRLCTALLWYWTLRGFHERAATFSADVIKFSPEIPAHASVTLRVIQALATALPDPTMSDFTSLIKDSARTDAMTYHPELAMILPTMAYLSGGPELAEPVLRTALTHSDPWARACGQWFHGVILSTEGDLDAASEAHQKAFAAFRRLGDRWGSAMALGMIATEHSLRGDSEAAISAYQDGLTFAMELGSVEDIVQQRWQLAGERIRAGDDEGARREIARAEQIIEDSGDSRTQGLLLFVKCDYANRTGDTERARELTERVESDAISTLPERIVKEWVAYARAAIAICERDLGKARAYLADAVEFSSGRKDMADAAKGAELLGRLQCLENDCLAAAAALGLSTSLRGQFDYGSPELRDVVDKVTAVVGKEAYAKEYERTALLSKEDAIARLRVSLGIEPETDAAR